MQNTIITSISLLLYTIFVRLYSFFAWVIAPFNQKAKLLSQGRAVSLKYLNEQLKGNQSPVLWFHSASLGEFEQARPLIEYLKTHYSHYKIIVTFFSPSGYEIRKSYPLADAICYLPTDTTKNAQYFLDIVQPKLIFFIKYDFWHYFIEEAHQRKIPLFLVSGIFRSEQIFFKNYGKLFQQILKHFHYLFVQNKESIQLLSQININNALISGDTRFDRVISIAKEAKDYPLMAAFKADLPLFFVGSAWQEDTDLLLPFLNEMIGKMKIVIAPHAISHSYMTQIATQFQGKTTYYSQAKEQNIATFDLLFVDSIGILPELYRYGDYAWIGGGLSQGLHNTIEAAVYGIPVFFGYKKYHQFDEAKQLMECGGGFCVGDVRSLKSVFLPIFEDKNKYEKISNAAKKLVMQNEGATQVVIEYLEKNQLITKGR